MVQNVPFLAISEFLRAKLNTWVMYITGLVSIAHLIYLLQTWRRSRRPRHHIRPWSLLESCGHQSGCGARYESILRTQSVCVATLDCVKKKVWTLKQRNIFVAATMIFLAISLFAIYCFKTRYHLYLPKKILIGRNTIYQIGQNRMVDPQIESEFHNSISDSLSPQKRYNLVLS
jgi:hypothetical protein